jgi:hypothetical protein
MLDASQARQIPDLVDVDQPVLDGRRVSSERMDGGSSLDRRERLEHRKHDRLVYRSRSGRCSLRRRGDFAGNEFVLVHGHQRCIDLSRRDRPRCPRWYRARGGRRRSSCARRIGAERAASRVGSGRGVRPRRRDAPTDYVDRPRRGRSRDKCIRSKLDKALARARSTQCASAQPVDQVRDARGAGPSAINMICSTPNTGRCSQPSTSTAT